MALADDLVRAVAVAMQGAAYGPATLRKARLAVAETLRQLAAHNEAIDEQAAIAWQQKQSEPWRVDFAEPPVLRALASAVERGGQPDGH